MRESDIQKLTMVALTKAGCKVFRANAGKFLSLDGQHVIQGLPNGFFDLFGFLSIRKMEEVNNAD